MQRGVGLAGDSQKVADDLIDKWAHSASISSLPEAIITELRHHEGERNAFISACIGRRDSSCASITREELLAGVTKGKSTAPGADGISNDILNWLASIEKGPLLDLFNMSFRLGRLPMKWKEAIIIPVPKGNGSYRPVSLTSCMCKMMERVILNRLLYLIGDNFSSNMYGFRKGKSTSDCIISCLSNTKDECRVFVDLQGAFDKANGQIILYELGNLGVSGNMLGWISNYLSNRYARVWFGGKFSALKHFELGTPQGGVLSPTLFNVLMNRIAKDEYPPDVMPIVYADDILIQSPTVAKMQIALNKLCSNCTYLGLVVNEQKTKYQGRCHKSVTLTDIKW